MDDLALARALHVAAVVLWIGGVAFVTTVLMPMLGADVPPAERGAMFQKFRRRFAWQARITTLLAGATGFYMTQRMHAWDRFAAPEFWWMHAMVGVWLLFTFMLFVAAPLAKRKGAKPAGDPAEAFQRAQRMHAVMLLLSLLTVLGAVAGAHGFFYAAFN